MTSIFFDLYTKRFVKGVPTGGVRRVIPWNTPEKPVRVGNTLYLDFAHAAVYQPDEALVRDEQGRVIGILENDAQGKRE